MALIRTFLAVLLVAAALAGCGPQEPLRLGFIGGLSGRVADLGIGGRNGAQLAVDQRNGAGGIHGRKIELIVEDDKQDTAVAKAAFNRLAGQKVEAIVGPMTSAVALAIVPLANERKTLLLSPTATTNGLSGYDDYLFRVVSATRSYSRVSADYHARTKGLRRIAALYDTHNRAYTESWLNDYREAIAAHGGTLVSAIEFASSDDVVFSELATRLLKERPDGILILANSVDSAMILQQIRKLDTQVAIAGSEWAATERLTELAGKAAEGFIAAQFHDRESRKPAYLSFRQTYRERFGIDPGFAGLTAFDATNILLDALEKKAADQSLKHYLSSRRSFTGLQSEIVFDDYGDVARSTYITIVKDGQFVVAH